MLIGTKGVWFPEPGLTEGGFSGDGLVGPESGHEKGSVRYDSGVPFRVLWRSFETPEGSFLGTWEAVLEHAEAVAASCKKCTRQFALCC